MTAKDFIKRQAVISALPDLTELHRIISPYDSECEIYEGIINEYEYLMNDTKKAVQDMKDQISVIQFENIDDEKILNLTNDIWNSLDYLEELWSYYH